MIYLSIILLISLLLGILMLWAAKNDELPILNIVAIILFIFAGAIIYDMITYDIPTAMDVYRGNTTLQITYKDNIPVDTIVVFK